MWRVCVFVVFTSLLACQTADDAEPGNAETYIKLIGSAFQDEPSQLIPITTPTGNNDGVLVLGTTENEPLNSFKIRLTRLDNSGNTIWERTYPEEDSAAFSYKGRAMIAVNDGYFIVGDSIRNEIEEEDGEEEEDEARSGLLLMKVDLDGVPVNNMMKTLDIEDADVQGHGIAINQDGDIAVVSQIVSEEPDEDILLTIFGINDLSVLCMEQYGVEDTNISLSPFLLTDPMGNYVFIGTVVENGLQNALPFIIPARCSATPLSVPVLETNDQNNYVGSQIINTLDGFAIIGTTDAAGLKPNIFMARLNSSARTQSISIYDNLGISDDEGTDEEEGLTIAATSDGGFIMSGSTRSNTDAGETNILLVKVDSQGAVQWTSIIGDLNEEEGTFITQASDGGYYVLGSTEFGGLDTIIVIKTDSEGNVE